MATSRTGAMWAAPQLRDLARVAKATIPARIGRELRHEASTNPGPRVQIRPAADLTVRPPAVPSEPSPGPRKDAAPTSPDPSVSAPGAAQQADAPPGPDASVPTPDTAAASDSQVRSRHLARSPAGVLTLEWDPASRRFTATSPEGQRWQDEHLDDLAMRCRATITEPVVLDLLRESGMSYAALAAPPPQPEPTPSEPFGPPVSADPKWVRDLLAKLPDGERERLRPLVRYPTLGDLGGQYRVEMARRAVRATWGVWVDEAPARLRVIEELGAIADALARGSTVDQAVRRLSTLVERFGPDGPGAGVPRAEQAVARLDALASSEPGLQPAVGAP